MNALEEGASQVTQSLVRNSPKEELLIEIHNAAKKTQERFMIVFLKLYEGGHMNALEEGASQVTQSLVRNSPKEELLIEIHNAAKKTQERLGKEYETKKAKIERDVKARYEAEYADSLGNLAKRWFNIGDKELKELPAETRQKLEVLIYEKSKKNVRRKGVLCAAFNIMVFTSMVATMGLFSGIIFTVMSLPLWMISISERLFITERKKLNRFLPADEKSKLLMKKEEVE